VGLGLAPRDVYSFINGSRGNAIKSSLVCRVVVKIGGADNTLSVSLLLPPVAELLYNHLGVPHMEKQWRNASLIIATQHRKDMGPILHVEFASGCTHIWPPISFPFIKGHFRADTLVEFIASPAMQTKLEMKGIPVQERKLSSLS
jgi:hypothetical protein